MLGVTAINKNKSFRRKNKIYRRTAVILALIFLLQVFPFHTEAFAAVLGTPGKFHIIKGVDLLPGDESLGHNGSPKGHVTPTYEVTFEWDPVTKSGTFVYSTISYIVTIYNDDNSVYKTPVEVRDTKVTISDLPSGKIFHATVTAKETELDENGIRINNSFVLSSPSEPLYFATNIDFTLENVASNVIRVKWDRVLNHGQDISYTIYYTDGVGQDNPEDFSKKNKTSGWYPVRILPNMIGVPGGYEVTDDGKIYTDIVLPGGTLWYFKIVPDLDSKIQTNENVRVLVASTKIILTATRMSGDLWRLNWSEVRPYDGSLVEYNLWRKRILEKSNGVVTRTDAPEKVATLPITQTYVPTTSGAQYVYYIEVERVPTPYSQEIFPLVSDEIELVQTIPYKPAKPEIPYEQVGDGEVVERILVEMTGSADDTKRYEYTELNSQSLKQIWLLPKYPASSEWDKDVYYDFWVVEDPEELNLDPENAPGGSTVTPKTGKIYTNVKMNESNYIEKTQNGIGTGEILGYRYTFAGLKPNTLYYVQIRAKKSFQIYDEKLGKVVEKVECSEPFVKAIVTPPEGYISQPEAISKPPLRIKINNINDILDEAGKRIIKNVSDFEQYAFDNRAVTEDTVVLQWKNHWWEVLDNGSWKSMWYEKKEVVDDQVLWKYYGAYDPAELPDQEDLALVYDGNHPPLRTGGIPIYREINHEDVVYTVYYAPYVSGETVSDLKAKADLVEIRGSNIKIDRNTNTVECTITGLNPNTVYAFWVTAERQGNNNISLPSDLVIATTRDDSVIDPIIPAVPKLDRSHSEALSEEAYIAWEPDIRYTYTLAYGTEDDLSKAKTILVSPSDMQYRGGAMVYHLTGLKPATTYYFWLQAIADPQHKSAFSNSMVLRTLDYTPPAPPTGFGVKTGDDSIGKDYIIFEWIAQPGLEYLLQISTTPDFITYKEYKVSVSNKSDFSVTIEQKVDGLQSNRWYYARLYAVDPRTGLISTKPAPERTDSANPLKKVYYLKVLTKRSLEDYDSDVDKTEPIEGDFVVSIEPQWGDETRTWTIEVLGINGDRLIQYMHDTGKSDYRFDLSNPKSYYEPKAYRIRLSRRLVDTLTDNRSNIIIDCGDIAVTLRPGALSYQQGADSQRMMNKLQNYNKFVSDPDGIVEVLITKESGGNYTTGGTDRVVSGVYSIRASVVSDEKVMSLPGFFRTVNNDPVNLSIEYYDQTWMDQRNISINRYDEEKGLWREIATTFRPETNPVRGTASADISNIGMYAVIRKTNLMEFNDLYEYGSRSELEELFRSKSFPSLEGLKNLSVNKPMTREAALKIALDILGYSYDREDLWSVGRKSGLLRYNSYDLTVEITREEFTAMLGRMYELLTKSSIPAASGSTWIGDWNQVTESCRKYVEFFAKNGVLVGIEDGYIRPMYSITRGDGLLMVKRMLELVGLL